jgi:hypothetical protein
MKLPKTYEPLHVPEETKRFWLFFSPAVMMTLFTGTIGFIAVPAGNIFGTNVAISLAFLSISLFLTSFTFGIIDYKSASKFEKEYDYANKEWIKTSFIPWVETETGTKVTYLFASQLLKLMPTNDATGNKVGEIINLYYLSMEEETRELKIRTEVTTVEELAKKKTESNNQLNEAYSTGANA